MRSRRIKIRWTGGRTDPGDLRAAVLTADAGHALPGIIIEAQLPTPDRSFVRVDELGHLREAAPGEHTRGRRFGRQGVGEDHVQAHYPRTSDQFTHVGGGDAAALARRRDGIAQFGCAVHRGALPASVAD